MYPTARRVLSLCFSSSDYEEDFEADDEGPVEEETVKEENSPSPFRETENLDREENTSETDPDDDKDDDDGESVSSYEHVNPKQYCHYFKYL